MEAIFRLQTRRLATEAFWGCIFVGSVSHKRCKRFDLTLIRVIKTCQWVRLGGSFCIFNSASGFESFTASLQRRNQSLPKIDPSDRSRRISYFAARCLSGLRQLAYALSCGSSLALGWKERIWCSVSNSTSTSASYRRLRLTNSERLLLVWLYRLFPSIVSAIRIVRPETVIRWHRRGFRAYWRWKSRPAA